MRTVFSLFWLRTVMANIMGPIPHYQPSNLLVLLNDAQACQARLWHAYPYTLMSQDVVAFTQRLRPFIQALNLSISANDHCIMDASQTENVQVSFCGDQTNLFYNGILNFDYTHDKFNRSLINEFLLQSTSRDCDTDSGTKLMLGFAILVLLAILLIGSVKAVESCGSSMRSQRRYEKFIHENVEPTSRANQQRLFNQNEVVLNKSYDLAEMQARCLL